MTMQYYLSSRFAEITDRQHAFMLLRKTEQNARKMLKFAETYIGQPGGLLAIERQLLGFFLLMCCRMTTLK